MWNKSSLIVLVALGLCCMCSGFLVTNTDPSLLLYFEKVVVSLKKTGEMAYNKVEFNNNNTKVDYNVIKNATDDKEFDIILNFIRQSSPADEFKVDALRMNWTMRATKRSYLTATNIKATVKGTTAPTAGGSPFGGDDLRLISQIKLEAPLNNSFHCGKFGKLYPAFVDDRIDNNNTLPFIDVIGLQIQAFNFKIPGNFSQSYDCVGFFTAGIWSGIFILAILIGVVTWGIAMIMDVKTMDRFDDPKGKPISFGGAE